jgi:hypothetical protein
MTDAAEEWERCRGWIEAALAHSPGFETIEDVEKLLGSNLYQLWSGDNCAAITSVDRYAQRLVISIIHGGGDKRELIDVLEPKIARFGAEHGCDMIAVTGRRGWIREGERHGYHFGYVTMMKAIRQ